MKFCNKSGKCESKDSGCVERLIDAKRLRHKEKLIYIFSDTIYSVSILLQQPLEIGFLFALFLLQNIFFVTRLRLNSLKHNLILLSRAPEFADAA